MTDEARKEFAPVCMAQAVAHYGYVPGDALLKSILERRANGRYLLEWVDGAYIGWCAARCLRELSSAQDASANSVEYAYTLENGENWSSDGLPAFVSDMELSAGTVIHRGVIHRSDASHFLPDSDAVIEHMASSAYDENSEWCDGFPDVANDALVELEVALVPLNNWANKHCDVNFYTVGKLDAYTITPEDVAAAQQYREKADQ